MILLSYNIYIQIIVTLKIRILKYVEEKLKERNSWMDDNEDLDMNSDRKNVLNSEMKI